jgi:hypothetical protein
MRKIVPAIMFFFALGLVPAGCRKHDGNSKPADKAAHAPADTQPQNKKPSKPPVFGTLAADLCSAGRIPGLMVQSVEFITRLRGTALMLDLQDKTLDQAIEEARAEMESLTGDMKTDLAAHPIESCEVMEEPAPCETAAADLSTGGGALFSEDAVLGVLEAMRVDSCGYLVVSYKLKGREAQSQKFLAGKTGGSWRIITEMPEMR